MYASPTTLLALLSSKAQLAMLGRTLVKIESVSSEINNQKTL